MTERSRTLLENRLRYGDSNHNRIKTGLMVDLLDSIFTRDDTDLATVGLVAAGINATAAELNKLDDSAVDMVAGAGIAGIESYGGGVFKNGTLITTRIVVDLTDLVGSGTDLDIIGDSAAASANFGQITAALNGTIIGGLVTCLEVPAGGADDIDFYSASVGTGTQDVAITDAALGTEVALVTSGAAWTSGATKGMTGLPAANDYLYIVNGEAAGGTFTAGKFLIELYGV